MVNGKKVSTYLVDFLLFHADGHEEYVEIKGAWTSMARLRCSDLLNRYDARFESRHTLGGRCNHRRPCHV